MDILDDIPQEDKISGASGVKVDEERRRTGLKRRQQQNL